MSFRVSEWLFEVTILAEVKDSILDIVQEKLVVIIMIVVTQR